MTMHKAPSIVRLQVVKICGECRVVGPTFEGLKVEG